MKRIWLIVITILVAYTWSDIYIWQRVFEVDYRYLNVLANSTWDYSTGRIISFFGMITVAILALNYQNVKDFFQKGLFLVGCSLTLSHSGLDDILYYWLDGKQIPSTLPWLDEKPLILVAGVATPQSLFVSVAIWLMFWFLITIWMTKDVK